MTRGLQRREIATKRSKLLNINSPNVPTFVIVLHGLFIKHWFYGMSFMTHEQKNSKLHKYSNLNRLLP